MLRTPGHTPEDISTVASTAGDVVACTHAWWGATGPAEDPLGSDAGALHASRDLLLSFASVIVPGHGAAFRPDQSTPRLARISMQRIVPLRLAELEAEAPVLPPGDGGVGGQVGLAQDG